MMKKIKNEKELLKKAMQVGEVYAKKRGFKAFSNTNSAEEKVEGIYRLLVNDKLVIPLPQEQLNGVNMRHRLVKWISGQLPKDHPLLQ